MDLIWSFFTIKKEVQCTASGCLYDFSLLSEKGCFFDPVTRKNMYVPYKKFRNVHNLNFLISEDIRNCLIANIRAFDLALTRLTGLKNMLPNYPLLSNSGSYVHLLERDAYNISQCIYINAFVELFFNYCCNDCPIPEREILSYLRRFPRYMWILESEQCSLGPGDCRIFLNSNTSIRNMNIEIDKVVDSKYTFSSIEHIPFYNDRSVVNAGLHTHPVTAINYNNCLIAGTGLAVAVACVYLTCY